MTMKTTCRYCGGPVSDEPTGGRPLDYCSSVCRRGAEAELRRLARRLERAEDERDRAIVAVEFPGPYGGTSAKADLQRAERLVELLRARQTALLAG